MSNVQSYNALIDRFKAFAAGHFILKRFSHGQIEVSDLEKFGEYPFMHVIPSNVTYSQGMKTFSFQIVLADLPRDKEDKTEYQREVLSDLQRIAEDLIAEITNHRVLFGDLITVQNVSLEPFLEEFQHTLTGWTISLDLIVPYYWDACSIPAEWNDMFESSTGGTGSILTFIDSITRDENGNVSLVNDEANPAPHYYYGTNDEGVRGWYLLTDEVGLTCVTLPTCQTIIDIEAAIDDLQADMLLKANTADISAVGFSNDYNDLDNKPTIPSLTGYVPYTGATQDVDLGTYNLTADHIALNVSPSNGGYVVGATQWNNTIGSSETLLKGGNVSLKNGVDLVARIVNKVTPNATLLRSNYQAVRVSGATGGKLSIALAQANADANSADTIGLVCEDIATNQEGFIITVGQLSEINTTGNLQGETWADGDVLYLSPTTAGRITNIKPTGATGHIVVLGYVEYSHAVHGSIYVKVMNGWELDELHNVYISSPANNDVLTYESSTSLWKNKTLAAALGYTPVPTTRSITINGTTQDLSADRTFTIASNPGTVTSVAALTLGTTGTDLSSTVANSTSTPVITLNVPTASATNRGALSSTDWSTFNGKFTLPSLTSGSVIFSNGTTIAQSNANFFWDNTNNRLGIGTVSPTGAVTIIGAYSSNTGAALVVQNTSAYASPFNQYSQLWLTSSGTTLAYLRNDGTLYTNNAINTNYFNGSVSGSLSVPVFNKGLGLGMYFPAANTLGLVTNSIEAIRIFSTQNIGIGTTTDAGFKLDVNGTARVGNLTASNVQASFNIYASFEVGAGVSGSINASSIMEARSTTKGFLPPRMTTTQKNAIASPAAGLMVYDTTLNLMSVYNGTTWITL